MTAENEPLIPKESNGKSSKVKYYHNQNVSFLERRRRRKNLERYNQKQSHLRELYEEDAAKILDETKRDRDAERSPDRILARLAFLLNIGLLFANLAASILSGSLAVITTFVDSAMDVTSSVILGICLWLINNTNRYNYPRGRERLELIGVVLCSVIMGIANMVMIMQSVTAIITHQMNASIGIYTVALILGGSSIKLILMIVCFRRGTPSSDVLAMDMRNDIATSFTALFCAAIGDRVWEYADPIGAIIVCGLIAINWFSHALEHIPTLVGIVSEQDNLSRILKIAIEHDDRIKKIDHVMVYHTGETAVVELHIVMDEDLPLKVTHDISHPLETKLAKLDFVERAFVHCDYQLDGDHFI